MLLNQVFCCLSWRRGDNRTAGMSQECCKHIEASNIDASVLWNEDRRTLIPNGGRALELQPVLIPVLIVIAVNYTRITHA